jgi:hypothetical protein
VIVQQVQDGQVNWSSSRPALTVPLERVQGGRSMRAKRCTANWLESKRSVTRDPAGHHGARNAPPGGTLMVDLSTVLLSFCSMLEMMRRGQCRTDDVLVGDDSRLRSSTDSSAPAPSGRPSSSRHHLITARPAQRVWPCTHFLCRPSNGQRYCPACGGRSAANAAANVWLIVLCSDALCVLLGSSAKISL